MPQPMNSNDMPCGGYCTGVIGQPGCNCHDRQGKAQTWCTLCGATLEPPATDAASAYCRPCLDGMASYVPPPVATEWADLPAMEPDALRQRLRSRADAWRHCAYALERLIGAVDFTGYEHDAQDIQLLIDLIREKEQRVTQEAERLWDERTRPREENRL